MAVCAATCQAGSPAAPCIGHTLGAVGCCQDEQAARIPLLALFSCSDGTCPYADWNGNTCTSLAEEVLLRPEGPPAALAATGGLLVSIGPPADYLLQSDYFCPPFFFW